MLSGNFVSFARNFAVDEKGEGGIKTEGEDVSEGRTVDYVCCFVEEAAEGGRYRCL